MVFGFVLVWSTEHSDSGGKQRIRPEMRVRMRHLRSRHLPLSHVALQGRGVFTSCSPRSSPQRHSLINFSKLPRPAVSSSKAQLVQSRDPGEDCRRGTMLSSSASVCRERSQRCQLMSHRRPLPCLIPIGFLPTHFHPDWLHTLSLLPIQKQLSERSQGSVWSYPSSCVHAHNCLN